MRATGSARVIIIFIESMASLLYAGGRRLIATQSPFLRRPSKTSSPKTCILSLYVRHTPWKRLFQQHHGSDPFNNSMGGTLSTTPWEGSFQLYHGGHPFNNTMGAILSTIPWERPFFPAISRDTLEPSLLAVGMTIIVHDHGWL